MTPEELDLRLASDYIDPVDDSWLQAASILAPLANVLSDIRDMLIPMTGGPKKPADLSPEDCIPMPPFLREKLDADKAIAKKQTRMNAQQMEEWTQRQYGPK